MYELEKKKNGRKEKAKAKRDSQTDRQTDCTYLVEINWNNLPGVRTQVRSYKSLETIIGTTDTPSSFTESCNPSSSLASFLHPPSI